MAYDLELARRIRERLDKLRIPEVEEKTMMGGLVFMVDDKMCVGVVGDALMCRIDPEEMHVALAREGCDRMAFTGRTMKGFVVVQPEGMKSKTNFEFWIGLALEFNPRAKSSKKPKRADLS
ncbi:MAG: TfoX/Sxy family protein [Fibrobacterota bacterium]|nr:TfoX/Sxy family protein [Fibrobacterota bacterium]QQS06029.1 MAG: TfoX/Sxy family protein [Fibrobacterota bacterium]